MSTTLEMINTDNAFRQTLGRISRNQVVPCRFRPIVIGEMTSQNMIAKILISITNKIRR